MARYGQAFKDRALARLVAAGGSSSVDPQGFHAEIGVSVATLERWRAIEALSLPGWVSALLVWTAAARMERLIVTASLVTRRRAAWCREGSLYPSELEILWRQGATAALAEPEEARASPQQTRHRPKSESKKLERESSSARTRRLAGDHQRMPYVVLSKALAANLQGGRGQMIRLEDRQVIAQAVEQAHKAGARLKPACELTGITVRTLQRWKVRGGSGAWRQAA